MKKKYFIFTFLFISGLFLISIIKNETRVIQKEINILKSSIKNLEVELHLANLDYNFLITPENLQLLTDQYLDMDFYFYKKSQIKKIFINEIINKKNISMQFTKK